MPETGYNADTKEAHAMLQTSVSINSELRSIDTDVSDDKTTPLLSLKKHYLGKLCSRGHDYEGTGQSLRYRNNYNCLLCLSENTKTYKRSNPGRAAASCKRWRCRVAKQPKNVPSVKQCSRCGLIKSHEEFYQEKFSADGLRSLCNSYLSETQSNRLAKNKKPKQITPVDVLQRKRREAKQRYKRTAKGKVASARHAHKRRISKAQGEHVPYSGEQLAQRFAQFNDECVYCGFVGELTIDHIVPLSKRGSDSLKNIVPACLICNSSKSNRDACTWY